MKYKKQFYDHVVNFYSQDSQDLEKIIFKNRKFLGPFLRFIKLFTITSKGIFVFMIVLLFFYNKFYIPQKNTKVYAYGLTNNNIKVFDNFSQYISSSIF